MNFEAGKSRWRCHRFVWWEPTSWLIDMCLFAVFSHGRRVKGIIWGLFSKVPPSWPRHLPKTSPPITITLGVTLADKKAQPTPNKMPQRNTHLDTSQWKYWEKRKRSWKQPEKNNTLYREHLELTAASSNDCKFLMRNRGGQKIMV